MKNFKKSFKQREMALYEAYQKEEKTKIRKIRLMLCLAFLFVSSALFRIIMLCQGYALDDLYLSMYTNPLIPLVFVVFSILMGFLLQWQYYPRWKLRDTFTLSIIKEAQNFGTTEFLGSMITCLQKYFTLSSTFHDSLIDAMRGYCWYDGEFTGDSYDMDDSLKERLVLKLTGDTYLLQKWEYTPDCFVFDMENISKQKKQTFRLT